MKHLLRPYRNLGNAVLLGTAAMVAIAPLGARAQTMRIVQVLEEPNPLFMGNGSQGYLGVDVTDVDQEKAQALRLREMRGAVITLIDHDAPAGQIGLKVNDVVLQLNGQNVEGAEQLRRMLREIPAGRKVSLEISRDGNVQTLAVELADRRIMEHDVWNKIGSGEDVFAQGSGMGILTGGGDAPMPGGFHMPFFGSTLNVGAMVEPLTSQMAEYLGVGNGLMVKQVAHKSEAATAGLKAFDVILKVGPDAIATLADWERALHANQGKPVQVMILRDKKQQTLTLQVDSKRKQGELNFEEFFPAGDGPMVVELAPQLAQQLAWNDEAAAEALRNQAEALKEQLRSEDFKIDPKQMEELKRQAEKLHDSFKSEDFKIDQKQMDELKQRMEEFRKNFRPEDFKIDPKQMNELRQQMEQLKWQMEDWQALGLCNHV
jgi:membrane-associated protease RseP (regulator of RpoE activity)